MFRDGFVDRRYLPRQEVVGHTLLPRAAVAIQSRPPGLLEVGVELSRDLPAAVVPSKFVVPGIRGRWHGRPMTDPVIVGVVRVGVRVDVIADAPAWLRVRPAGADDEVHCE